MAPRKGLFVAKNKVKPSSDRQFNSAGKTVKVDEGKSDFFVKPGTSGSTQDGTSKLTRNVPSTAGKTERKPFDKKKWRLQRYSNKYKVQQWEEKRKKAVMREYYKQIDDRPKFDVKKIYENAEDEEKPQEEKAEVVETRDGELEGQQDLEKSSFRKRRVRQKVQKEFERIKEEKSKKKEEALKRKAEKDELLKAKKEERLSKFKRLNKRTRKGQPIMKDRMELLLEQIQKTLQK